MNRDVEQIIEDFIQITKDNLNDKIVEIQAEKDALLGASNFDVSAIDSNAYFDQLDTRVANYDPFVYYGISDLKTSGYASAISLDISMFNLVVFSDNFEDENAHKKALRYTRALSEIYRDNFASNRSTSGYEVSQMVPESTKFNDGDGFFKLGGILVNFSVYN